MNHKYFRFYISVFISFFIFCACNDQTSPSGIRKGLTCSFSIMPCPFGEVCREVNDSIECIVPDSGHEAGHEAGHDAGHDAGHEAGHEAQSSK